MTSSSIERALQRQRAYGLLSKIFAEGVTPEVTSLIQEIPILTAVLPTEKDEDQARAEYQEMFGFNILPYAGVFLAEDGKLGGGLHYELNSFYDSFGFEPEHVPGVPDHISAQLEFLSFLSQLEVDAHGAPSPKLITTAIHQQQSAFFHRHLLTWCFPFSSAIIGQRHPFYTEVAELTRALIVSHYSEIAAKRREEDVLADSPDIMSSSRTGIKEIASFLCRPVHCGFYLTRRDIKYLAGSLNIPSGFGDRVQTLSNTIRSAINFDTLPALLDKLKEIAQFHRLEYEAQKTQQIDYILQQWISKAEFTLEILTRIESELPRLAELD